MDGRAVAAATPAERLARALRRPDRPALIAFVVAGDPDLEFTARLLPALEAAGVDAIELGMPFSDPLADGPVIQRASARALRAGVRLADVLDLVRRARAGGVRVPLLLFSYVNPLLAHGLERVAALAAETGCEGILVPDLPHEERGPLVEACRRHGLAAVPFVAPTTDLERVRRIAREASGFLYCVSLTGVTGSRERLAPEARELLARARAVSPVPLALGFGIARPEHVAAVRGLTDAVVVGSALIERLEAHAGDPEAAIAAAAELIRSLAGAGGAPGDPAGAR